MVTPVIKKMHPSSLLSALAIGIYSFSLVQGSNIKKPRVNRLKSHIAEKVPEKPDTVASVESQQVVNSQVNDSEPTGLEAIVAAVSTVQPQVEVEIIPEVSLEDSRAVVFHSLYNLYENVVGRYINPGQIEWSRVKVFNWPSYIDKSDMTKWSKDDVQVLSDLIKTNLINFGYAKGKKDSAKPLSIPKPKFEVPVFKIKEVAKKEEEKLSKSDSESDSDSSSLVSVSDVEAVMIPVTRAENLPVEVASVNTENLTSLKPKTKKEGNMRNLKNIKIVSNVPADPVKKAAVLEKALKIYRETSGHLVANEIDWTLAKVIYLQNHKLPFSTSLETEGDVLTLEAAMKLKNFGFHNLETLAGRRTKLFENFYQLYRQVPNLIIDPFHITWNQIEVKGWPQGVTRSYSQWKNAEIEQLEALLAAGEIKFSLRGAKKQKKVVRKIKRESSDSESDSESESDLPIESSSEADFSSADSESSSFEMVKKDKKRRRVLQDSDEEFEAVRPKKIPSAIKEQSAKAKTVLESSTASVFADEPVEQVEILKTAIIQVIENLNTKKEIFAQGSRHQRIISEMLKCVCLLQKHANEEIAEIPASELVEFLEIFNESLEAIDVNGEMEEESLTNFVINAIKLRARLAGVEYKIQQGKRLFNIPKSRIADLKTFGFLNYAESRWIDELQLLELMLDEGQAPIFCQPGSKVNHK